MQEMRDAMIDGPLRFAPLLKRTIWGGRRLGELLRRPIGPESDYAESWEIVDHGRDQSVVVGGAHAGKSLTEIFASSRRWLMGDAWIERHPDAKSFPLLLKFLDCNRVLSVQVHPEDAYAAQMHPPDLGKTEAWVILHSERDSIIYAGLRPGIDRDQLARMIRDGKTEAALHSFHPEVGDCVFIPAGTVHALGGGLVVAEIQQSSDTTFRLFDWNRVDASGQSRPLHIEPSLEVTDFSRGPVDPVCPSAMADPRIESLVRCDKFDLVRLTIDSPSAATPLTIGGDGRCHLLVCLSGTLTLRGANVDERLTFGDCRLVPAACSLLSVVTKEHATLLRATPDP